MATVTCNGDMVANSINAIHGKSLLSYFMVYDPKYERASPGIVLLVECTHWAFNNGFTAHDHLRGLEPYKLPFCNTWTVVRGYTGAVTARGHAALLLRPIGMTRKHSLRRRRQRLDPVRHAAIQATVPA
jgi:CelD/BcsL family acetyltransferase involved in cellulose biosynthesis